MKIIHRLNIRLLVILVIFVSLMGCNKEESEFSDTPIVESYLEPGACFSVSISRQIPFLSEVTYSSDDIDHLAITVTYNNAVHTLNPVGNGIYTDSTILVSEGTSFDLNFTYNSKNVNAYTYIPTKPTHLTQSATEITIERMDSTSGPPSMDMPDPITITWDNADESYYLLIVENTSAVLDPIRDFGDAEPPGNRFRKSPTNGTSEEIRSMDFQYYGTHRVILYHVLPDYAALYKQNSTSSQNLTNPSTSIINGYGIFTGMNSDTLYIEVKED
jgi:hypothetical protein